MVSARRNKPRKPARQALNRQPRRRFLVLCEGEVTEPAYLRGLQRWSRAAIIELEIPSEQGVALTLVRAAVRLKDEAQRQAKRESDPWLEYDEVWCLFDDEHPHIDEAKQLASNNGVELAISNPCFELWLALHFIEPPGPRTCAELAATLKQHVPGYDKHVDFERFKPGYDAALGRALRLARAARADGEDGRNPSTGVYELALKIRPVGERESR